jgi:hypothetical protein
MSKKAIPGCPVLQDTRQIQGLSHDLTKSLRKLRRDLAACRKCPHYDNCQVLKDFNNMVQTALAEIAGEWDYTPVPEEN